MHDSRIPRGLALFALLFGAAGVSADDGASSYVNLPVVVSVEGRGGVRFHTQVAILNTSDEDNEVSARLTAEGSWTVVPLGTLPPGGQISFEDFLPEVVGVTGVATVTIGGFRPIAVSAAVWSETSEGRRFSARIPPWDAAASSIQAAPVVSLPVTVDERTRTNLACANLSNDKVFVVAQVHSGEGIVESRGLSPGMHRVVQIALENPVAAGWVSWTSNSPGESGVSLDNAAVCWSVTVDNATGDARISVARRDAGGLEFHAPWNAPRADAPGDTSALRISLLDQSAQTISLSVVGAGAQGASSLGELRPGVLGEIDDTALLGAGVASDQPFVLFSAGDPTARATFRGVAAIVTDGPFGRRFTDFPELAGYVDPTIAVSPGIRVDERTRTILNCPTVPHYTSAVAIVRDATGALLREFGRDVWSRVASVEVDVPVANGSVAWTLAGDAVDELPQTCWASVVDRASGDETIVPAKYVSRVP